MKLRLTGTGARTRWLLFSGAVFFLGSAFVTPLLAHPGRAILMAAFDPFCHQLPERSFWLAGAQVAICHRCTGIAAGLIVGLAVGSFRKAPLGSGWLLVIALVPVAGGWLLEAVGAWGSLWLRLATGLFAGFVVGRVVAGATRSNKDVSGATSL